MANSSPYLTDQAVLGASPDVVGLERQRRLADLLTSQAFQSPQGQMISGQYVKPATTQQLQPLLGALLGSTLNKSLDEKQGQLAAALRSQETASIEEYQKIKAEKGPAAANAYLAKQSSPTLRSAGLKEMLAPPQTKEVTEGGKIFQQDANGNWKEVATGGAKYRAPLHFDLGGYISVRDPNDPTKEIQRLPKGLSPESSARLADEGIGSYGGGGGAFKPSMQGTSPSVGVNSFQDFNNSIVPPAGLSPKDSRKYMAEANTPLTGDSSSKVQGGLDTIDAIDSYRKILTDYSKLSSLNPTQRANLQAAYYTMTLKSKEANKLGVLNGRDQEILEKLAPNPNDIKSLLVTNEVLSEQALKQRNLITGFTVNAYGEQRKKIPEYVINKIQPLKKEITPFNQSSQIDPKLLQFMTPEQQALFAKPRQ